MKYQVVLTKKAQKFLNGLDAYTKKLLFQFIENKLSTLEDPRSIGKPLSGNYKEYWCYRVGDYRFLTKVVDDKLIIYVIKISHRRDIYQ